MMRESAPASAQHRAADYLVIGHVTTDITPEGPVVGGTVSFAGRMAQALGRRTAVLTSAGPTFDYGAAFPSIDVAAIPADEDTTMENVYTADGRVQYVYGVAAPLTPADVPAAWQDVPIIHLAPLVKEVDPAFIDAFADRLVGLTPQGWLRCWDGDGRVRACDWPLAERYFARATAVVLSHEDLPEPGLLNSYRQWARLLVMTQGPAGCTVFLNSESRQIPVERAAEVNPTGACDIFAAAFFSHLLDSDDPWRAAAFANEAAAYSVTQKTLADKVAWRPDGLGLAAPTQHESA